MAGSMLPWRRCMHTATHTTCQHHYPRVHVAAVSPAASGGATSRGERPRGRLFDGGNEDDHVHSDGEDQPSNRSRVMPRRGAGQSESVSDDRGNRPGRSNFGRRCSDRDGARSRQGDAAATGDVRRERFRDGGRGDWNREGNKGERYREGGRGERFREGGREDWNREGDKGERYREGDRGEQYREGGRAGGTDVRLSRRGEGDVRERWEESASAPAVGSTVEERTAQEGTSSHTFKPPVVRPLLDLPVVRQDRSDKGTFFAQRERWDELGLSKDVVDALRQLGLTRPSHVQAATLAAWKRVDTQHVAIADQAGSGKTLAYLLPLVQAIRSQDTSAGKPCTVPKCPRAIILTPTVELVQQVYRVAKALSSAGARMRVAAMTGGQEDSKERNKSLRTQREQLSQGVDLLVATPGRLVEHIKSGHLELGACRGLVLDEVDVLLGNTAAFEEQMEPLRAAAPPHLRFVLVTATLPQHTADMLRQSFKDITLVSGPGLHRTAAGLVEELVDCSGGEEVSLETGTQRKLEALQQVLRQHQAPRTLVFCNKIESCRDVENELRRKYKFSELQVLVYHEAIREDLRQAAMNAFLSPVGQEAEHLNHLEQYGPKWGRSKVQEAEEAEAESAGSSVTRRQGPPRLVMVATDRMSRGIDSMWCQHVVLFDFPRDPSEYVRRVGRTARGAGGTGVVSALVLGRQVALAREIMRRNEKGQPVHRLPRL